MPAPDPTNAVTSRNEVYNRYLDYFRTYLITKCRNLSGQRLRTSVVPSGWTPMELLNHLRYVELRWLVWGFLGEAVDGDLFADQGEQHWAVDPAATLDDLVVALEAQGDRTRDIVARHDLAEISRPGPAWDEDEEPAQLERILMHLVQEYAHHAGHIDIVAELATDNAGGS
jgi:uncharacterized damage-inducible protein DinB